MIRRSLIKIQAELGVVYILKRDGQPLQVSQAEAGHINMLMPREDAINRKHAIIFAVLT